MFKQYKEYYMTYESSHTQPNWLLQFWKGFQKDLLDREQDFWGEAASFIRPKLEIMIKLSGWGIKGLKTATLGFAGKLALMLVLAYLLWKQEAFQSLGSCFSNTFHKY